MKKRCIVIELEEIERDAIIGPSCFQSFGFGQGINPLLHADTVGKKPSEFAPERSFWKPISIIETRSKS